MLKKEMPRITRQGYCQCFAEVVVLFDGNEQQQIMQSCLKSTMDDREFVKEAYLNVSVYLTIIMKTNLDQLTDLILEFIPMYLSDSNEIYRSLSIKSIKTII